MNKINNYDISLLSNNEKLIYYINDNFFKLFISNNVDFFNPKINILLRKKNYNNVCILNLNFRGVITLICDISYNNFLFKINKKKQLNIVFGKKKKIYEEYDNYLIVPYNSIKINIAQYIYDSIILMIPFKRVDPKIKKKYII